MAKFIQIDELLINLDLVTFVHWNPEVTRLALHFSDAEHAQPRACTLDGDAGRYLFDWLARHAPGILHARRPQRPGLADSSRQTSVLANPHSFYTD